MQNAAAKFCSGANLFESRPFETLACCLFFYPFWKQERSRCDTPYERFFDETMKRIFIVDGQKAVRQLLSESLERRGFEVVGHCDGAEAAVKGIIERRPQIVVLEMSLGQATAGKLIVRLRDSLPDLRFLIFSDEKTPPLVKGALQAGAHGFVEKSVDFDMFLNAVKIVSGGGCFFGFNISEVIRQVVSDPDLEGRKKDSLTEREREVLRLIAMGNSNKDIAAQLKLSVKTVDNHRCSMMRKLDVHNVASITRYAMEHRMVEVNFAC